MKYTQQKLTELQIELKNVVKDVAAGKLSKEMAAEKIVHLREEMDKVIEYLKTSAR